MYIVHVHLCSMYESVDYYSNVIHNVTQNVAKKGRTPEIKYNWTLEKVTLKALRFLDCILKVFFLCYRYYAIVHIIMLVRTVFL